MLSRRVLSGFAVVLVLCGVGQIAHGLYLPAKAWLAQELLLSAWGEMQSGARQVRPWPWADTWPVARLRAARHDVDLIVLAGDTGRTLAFGPGVNLGLAQPGEEGLVLISAHRDTHFGFLRGVELDDVLTLETAAGSERHYRVKDTRVADASVTRFDADADALVLVTCYPFDALVPGGPLRFVVIAAPVETEQESLPIAM